jgi:hypothetical protein
MMGYGVFRVLVSEGLKLAGVRDLVASQQMPSIMLQHLVYTASFFPSVSVG